MKFKTFYEKNSDWLVNTFNFSYPKIEWKYLDYVQNEYLQEIKDKNIPTQKAYILWMEQFIKENKNLFT